MFTQLKTKPQSKLKMLKITQKMLSKWFNYSSPDSFRNSSAKKDMMVGCNLLAEYIINAMNNNKGE